MGKRKKIPNKDGVSWIKPETKKIRKITAKCTHTKGNTQKLIKKHEELIKKEVKNDLDDLKAAKVKQTINNLKNNKISVEFPKTGSESNIISLVFKLWKYISRLPDIAQKSFCIQNEAMYISFQKNIV